MIKVLQEIILDSQDIEIFSGVPRRLDVTSMPGKATVCIGVRRSGKSTFMSQLIQKLLGQGVSCQNILYLNFFNNHGFGKMIWVISMPISRSS